MGLPELFRSEWLDSTLHDCPFMCKKKRSADKKFFDLMRTIVDNFREAAAMIREEKVALTDWEREEFATAYRAAAYLDQIGRSG